MSYPKTYILGNVLRLSAAFTNAAGAPADPTSTDVAITQPDGVATSATLVKDSVGNYHADFTPTQAGLHIYRITGTGVVAAANEQSFIVQTAV